MYVCIYTYFYMYMYMYKITNYFLLKGRAIFVILNKLCVFSFIYF